MNEDGLPEEAARRVGLVTSADYEEELAREALARYTDVRLIIAAYVHEMDTRSVPPIRVIARLTGRSPGYVVRALDWFEAHGLLRRPVGRGGRRLARLARWMIG